MEENTEDTISDDEEDSLTSQGTEKCFSASFKIFLNSDSKENVLWGPNQTDGPCTGEVVRIEKTQETSQDDLSDEDDKTLSLSNENILDRSVTEIFDDTDNDAEDMDIKIVEDTMSSPQWSQGSMRGEGERFEWTQSVDSMRDRSQVFYLDPGDWRVSTCSNSPYRDKQPKLLESLARNLDVLTESEENLSTELETITSHPPPLLNISREGSVTPPLTRPRSRCSTAPPLTRPRSRCSTAPPLTRPPSTPISRCSTPLLDRQRKVPIPILCSRGAWMAEQLNTPGSSPVNHSGLSPGSRRSLDVEALSLFHSPRLMSPRPVRGARSLSTLLNRVSTEDVRKSRLDPQGLACSFGNIQNLGKKDDLLHGQR